ncbi:MAG: zf-HC2 domain-containing protein [Armatimonadetes bacterium]|nr:zf-HC2 domain-containing protein [Armatimonadota bacterium]
MRCEIIRPMLSDYIDREMSFSLRLRIAGHLNRCPECREELEALERTVGMLSLAAAPRPVGDLWESVRRQIEAQPFPAPSVRRPPLVRAWVVAAAFVLGLGMFGSMIRFQRPPAEPETEAFLVGEYARFQQSQPVADWGGMSLLVGESFRRQVEPEGR